MKTKFYLAAILILFMVADANGQFRSGIKGGVIFSRFNGDVDPFAPGSKYHEDYIGFKKIFRSGATGGLFAEFSINEATTFGSEILYSAKGAKYRYRNTNVYLEDEDGNKSRAYDTYTYQTDYLEVPLYLQLNTRADFEGMQFSVYGGVSPALSINRKRVYRYYDHEGFAVKGDQKKMKRELENVRTMNLFPLTGVKLGSRDAFLDVRFSTSLRPIFANTSVNPETDFNTRMTSITATVGFYL